MLFLRFFHNNYKSNTVHVNFTINLRLTKKYSSNHGLLTNKQKNHSILLIYLTVLMLLVVFIGSQKKVLKSFVQTLKVDHFFIILAD